jgi:hypothetical protein
MMTSLPTQILKHYIDHSSPRIQAERDPVPQPLGKAECYGACSDVGVPLAVGAPPPVQWARRRRWAHPLLFPR